MSTTDAAYHLTRACTEQGIDPRTVFAHLAAGDLRSFLTHENVDQPGYWRAVAWAQATSAAGGFCSCRRCVIARRGGS